ncbi:MAG: molybdopterin-dependent oxidoreductase [Deltaproteobacteria bacterium]|nr:molybdopterin-dependent oxidoreductase [Deltaproteobacteria bacterium]
MESKDKKLTDRIALNRRNFIKLLVGGAVGINLTPLPWKLTDDVAIWTQNWPWVPVPPVGEVTLESTFCTLCPGGCGIEVRKVEERAVKIEGRTDYPVNPGGICPLGAGGLQLLYNENIRFTSPMKRVGSRGSGDFVPISWDEALREVLDRIRDLRKNGRPEALAAVNGYPRESTMAHLVERFIRSVGSPNYLRIPDADDTCRIANRLMTGSSRSMAYDLENSDFVLSFGCGLIEGWGAPGRMIHAWGIWHDREAGNRKVKVVQVESKASLTASKADQWVAVRPGTETALALGLAHVMVKKGLYHRDFIDHYAFGFEDWLDDDGTRHQGFKTLVLHKYTPEKVSAITGVDAGRIVALAEDFARAKKPVALFGKGKGDVNGNLLECMAVQALNALAGRINRPGGVILQDPVPLGGWPEIEADAVTEAGWAKGRLDQAGERYPFTDSLINGFSEALLQDPSAVDMLLVFGANPVFTLPDGGLFRRALEKIPFIVSFSPFRDDTALMADLILPDHSPLEKVEDIPRPRGLQYPLYGVTKPVVKPLYDTRHSGDVVIELARRLGGKMKDSFPWKNFEEALQARVRGLYESGPGLTRYDGGKPVWKSLTRPAIYKADYGSFQDFWKGLRKGGFWYRPLVRYGGWADLFKTPSGKFEFYCTSLQEAFPGNGGKTSIEETLKSADVTSTGDEAFMPHFESAEVSGDYPLLLVPYELINLSSGPWPNPHFLNKTLFDYQLSENESFAEIHPGTASTYHLKEGDRIYVDSPAGRVRVRVHLFEGAMPGVVFLPLGFGHHAYDEYQKGKGVNPNDLISPRRDPLSGLPAWWNTRVKISRA